MPGWWPLVALAEPLAHFWVLFRRALARSLQRGLRQGIRATCVGRKKPSGRHGFSVLWPWPGRCSQGQGATMPL
eukprot:9528760-Alexandrium_andersonii.AAC.2